MPDRSWNKMAQPPRLLALVEQVLADINELGLKPGQRYLTSEQLAHALGVRKATANRALQVLANRGVLIRKPRLGTLIADPAESISQPAIADIHLIVRADYLRAEGRYAEDTLVGLRRAIPGAAVMVHFLPEHDAGAYVQRTINDSMRGTTPQGLVLVRSSLSIQRLVQDSGLPAVIHGGAYPGVTRLPWLNIDNESIGRIQFDYMHQRGCKRIVLLRSDTHAAGDADCWRGLCAAGAGARWLADSIIPADTAPFAEQVDAVLSLYLDSKTTSSTTGIIASSEKLADLACEALRRRGLTPGSDVQLTINTVHREGNQSPPSLPHIRMGMAPGEQGEALGRMLLHRTTQSDEAPMQEMIEPVLVDVN